MELATQNIIAAVVGIIVAWIVIKLIWDKYKGGDREGIFDSVDPWVQLAVSVAFRASEKNYKETGIALAGKKLARHTAEITKTGLQIAGEQERKAILLAQSDTLTAEIQEQKNQLLKAEKLLASRQKVLNEQKDKIRTLESDIKLKNEIREAI